MKKTSKHQPAPEITFTNVPLTEDAYTVSANLTVEERERLMLAWHRMNSTLATKKMLLVIPESVKLEKVPSGILRRWINECSALLKERGEL